MYNKRRSYPQSAYNTGSAAPQQNGWPAQSTGVPAAAQQQNNNAPPMPNAITHPQQTAPQTNQANQYAKQSSNGSDQQPANNMIDNTIVRFATNKAAMDFSCRLVKAYQQDYANIHGCGGNKHAPNSSIQLNICDYSKGTGENSVSVHFNIDVREISRLRSAVEAANIGTLGLTEQLKGVREFATANGMVIGWLQSGHQPTYQELAGLQQTLCNGLTAQDPDNNTPDKVLWKSETLKTNPYRAACELIDGVEFAPVSTFIVEYTPAKNYQWTLRVANFMAPLVRNTNGSSYARASQAIRKTEALFPISTADLFDALCQVEHYISLWEYRMYPTINAMCTERERRWEEKRLAAQAR